ncbi:hypothetical protein KY290_015563 [Solanum tuberosum]|uniref:F-box domain-containing protein n=1 Tax=Solanum tuberosum TaxID=4113 RepID=A0ABQ7VSU9_SOLTU|nr:hypothetical protein KY290_015563 [Solanum tuberosum]
METPMHIQEEIVMDMLSRLTVKSLFRFKCVSNSWKALICEPSFKKQHLNHAKNDKLLVLRIAKDSNVFFYCSSLLTTTTPHQIVRDVQESVCVPQCVPGYYDIYNYHLYGNCNGLFLIGIKHKRFLCNPSTRESILLPSHWDKFFHGYIHGMGYDPTSDDYKVVHIPEEDEKAPTEILSLKTGSWRKIYGGDCSLQSGNMECLTLLRGSFHWLTYSVDSMFSLISFNISNEVFGGLPLSKEMPLLCDTIEQGVTVLSGMLSVNFLYEEEDATVFDLWVMKEYGMEESWTKLFTMRDSRDAYEVLPVVPKYIFADGELLFRSDRRIVLKTFKKSDKRSNLVVPLTTDEDTDTTRDGFVYTETLISPKDCVIALN